MGIKVFKINNIKQTKRLLIYSFCLLFVFSCICFAKARNIKTVTIKSGDSISYLCFKYYKKYNKNIFKSIKKYNPQVKNFNRIYVGQKIKFPKLSLIKKTKKLALTPIKKQNLSKRPQEIKTKKAISKNSIEIEKSNSSEVFVKINKTKEEKKIIRKNKIRQDAFITYFTGNVYVKNKKFRKWKKARINQKLAQGDKIKVKKKSKAEIITYNGDIIRLDENTELKISKLENNPIKKIRKFGCFLSLGKMWNKAKRLLTSKSEYTVRTPNAISGIRGTSYNVKVENSNDTVFKTYSGSVKIWKPEVKSSKFARLSSPVPVAGPHPVSRKEWTEIILRMNQELTVTKNGVNKKDFDPVFDEQNDKWVKWNMLRDKEFENTASWN